MSIEVIGCIFLAAFREGESLWREERQVRYTSARHMDRSQIEKISKALADGTRLRIFEAISANDHMNCGEIVSMRGVTPATVSQHLYILMEARLIDYNHEKLFVCSPVAPAPTSPDTRTLTKH